MGKADSHGLLLGHAIAGKLWRFTHIFTTLIFNNGAHGNASAAA
jgi:hypothetical protein